MYIGTLLEKVGGTAETIYGLFSLDFKRDEKSFLI